MRNVLRTQPLRTHAQVPEPQGVPHHVKTVHSLPIQTGRLRVQVQVNRHIQRGGENQKRMPGVPLRPRVRLAQLRRIHAWSRTGVRSHRRAAIRRQQGVLLRRTRDEHNWGWCRRGNARHRRGGGGDDAGERRAPATSRAKPCAGLQAQQTQAVQLLAREELHTMPGWTQLHISTVQWRLGLCRAKRRGECRTAENSPRGWSLGCDEA
mmetsp:Transcript_15239/g.38517  ORF Transcript_15239/g.38517 Transcript_15239/m.38517 type:complete len:208 (+) Transcript_15239:147-770(+)